MRLTILYFAGVRDVTGRAEERLELDCDETNVGGVEQTLLARYPALAKRASEVRYAVNEVFASREQRVLDGATVAVLPPVAGG